MSESQSASRSRLELARDEVDRVFGEGSAAAHPELVVATVHAASSDWAARVICAALEDSRRAGRGRRPRHRWLGGGAHPGAAVSIDRINRAAAIVSIMARHLVLAAAAILAGLASCLVRLLPTDTDECRPSYQSTDAISWRP
jgi:hypothetical protein